MFARRHHPYPWLLAQGHVSDDALFQFFSRWCWLELKNTIHPPATLLPDPYRTVRGDWTTKAQLLGLTILIHL